MFCGKCGKELKEGAAFCPGCGAPVMPPANPGVPVQQPGMPVQPGAAMQPPGQPLPPAVGGKPEKKKNREKKDGKKKGKTAVAIAAAVLAAALAAGGVTGIVRYFNGDDYQCSKNLEEADRLFEAGQYEEALASYAAALKLNAGLAEPYLRCADIYLSMHAYEDAIGLLCRGNRRTNWQKEEIGVKLEEVYLSAVQYYTEQREYGQAYAILEEGLLETDSAELSAQKSGIYLAEETYYLESGDYNQALKVLEKGAADTGDASLEQERVRIYIQMADICLQAGDYAQALTELNRGIAKTGDPALEEEKVRVYRTKSDQLLANGEYMEAIQALEDGERDTDAAQLREREEYLRQNIVITEGNIYNYGNLYGKMEYDAAGMLVRESFYDNGGMIMLSTEYTYSGDGNTVAGATLYYDTFGNAVSRSESEEIFDERGETIKLRETYYGPDGSVLSSFETEKTYAYENDLLVRCDAVTTYYIEDVINYQENTVTVYEYDENGSQQATQYDSSGNVAVSELTFYDENGNATQIQSTIYNGSDGTQWWRNRTFNTLGDLTGDRSSSWWNSENAYSYEYVYQYAYIGE